MFWIPLFFITKEVLIRASYITIDFTKTFKSSNVSNNINNDLKKKDISFKELFYKKMNYDELHNNNSESTRMSYEENVRHHIFPIIGEKSIYELNVNDFDQIILHLKLYKIEKGKNKEKNLSSKFMNEIIHTVKSVIRYGIELYDMNEKFLKYLPDIKKDKDKVQQINPLELQNEQLTISPEDWDKVAKAMEEIINETPNEKKEFVSKMMLFLTTEYILLTRVGETQAMRYSNLLFDNGMYNLYEAYCKRVKK